MVSAAGERYQQQIRLLQLVSAGSRRVARQRGGLIPSTLALLMAVQATIETAITAGVVLAEGSLERAIMWLTAFGGVFVAEDLAAYLPSVRGRSPRAPAQP